MKYRTRKLVMHGDLNGIGILFGGRVLEWIDEEAYIYSTCQLGTDQIVTRSIGHVGFKNGANVGDIVEFGIETVKVGNTSITLRATVRNMKTKKIITTVDDIVFVNIKDGKPYPHGKKSG